MESIAPAHMVEKKRLPSAEYSKRLASVMNRMARRTNDELQNFLPEELRGTDILSADGSISLHKIFLRKHGGENSKEDLKKSREEVRERQLEWIEPEIESVRAYYREKFGAETEDEIIAAWEHNKLEHDGTIAELAITSILHKFLGGKFIVMRASQYDDYMNGVDNVIVEKETGNIVCAFDEVTGNEDDPEAEKRMREKLGKIRRGSETTGTTIKYGISLERDESGKMRLVGKEFKNVPTFCLRISRNELYEILREIGEDIDAPAGETETRVFRSLIESLKLQSESMRQDHALLPEVRKNLENFQSSLRLMEE